jgi:hypothetical protein
MFYTKITKWKSLVESVVGVRISAGGIVDIVPHDVALAWMRDGLELFKEQNLG